MALRRHLPAARGAVVAACACVALVGCGTGRTTALAIEDVRWRAPGELEVTTECATDLEVEVGPDNSGVGVPEVTVWGTPALGTCEAEATVAVPEGTTRIVDGTTSMVVDLPPAR